MELERLRVQKGMTRRALSLASGVTETSIWRYERRRRMPDARTAYRLCNALGCTIEEFLGTEETEQKEGGEKRDWI